MENETTTTNDTQTNPVNETPNEPTPVNETPSEIVNELEDEPNEIVSQTGLTENLAVLNVKKRKHDETYERDFAVFKEETCACIATFIKATNKFAKHIPIEEIDSIFSIYTVIMTQMRIPHVEILAKLKDLLLKPDLTDEELSIFKSTLLELK